MRLGLHNSYWLEGNKIHDILAHRMSDISLVVVLKNEQILFPFALILVLYLVLGPLRVDKDKRYSLQEYRK